MKNNDKKKKNIKNALENNNKGTDEEIIIHQTTGVINTFAENRKDIMIKVMPDSANTDFIEKKKKKKRNIIIALSLVGAAAAIGGGIAIKNKSSETMISGDMEYVEPKENNLKSNPSDDDVLSGLVEQIDN